MACSCVNEPPILCPREFNLITATHMIREVLIMILWLIHEDSTWYNCNLFAFFHSTHLIVHFGIGITRHSQNRSASVKIWCWNQPNLSFTFISHIGIYLYILRIAILHHTWRRWQCNFVFLRSASIHLYIIITIIGIAILIILEDISVAGLYLDHHQYQ